MRIRTAFPALLSLIVVSTLFSPLQAIQFQPPVATGTGVITGKIIAVDGSPVAKVRVAAVPVVDSNVSAAPPMLSNLAQTDAAGNYRLENVAPGAYYITAGLVDRPTYYPGSSSPGANGVVRVTADASVTGIDFRLVQSLGLKVSGRVDGVTSLPPVARGARIGNLALSPRTAATMRLTADIQNDLTFEFTNVPPGTYSVQLTSLGSFVLKENMTITVRDSNLADVILTVVDSALATIRSGLEQAWSLPGSWRGIAADFKTGTLYAGNLRRVAFGPGTGTLAQFDSAGNLKGEIPFVPSPTLRLAHFNDKQPAYLCFGTWSPNVQAFDSQGQLLWTFPDAANPGQGIDDVWPIDLDGDQSDEVIVGFNGSTGLYVLDSKGKVLWQVTGSIGNVWHVSGGDVRGDGKPLVVTTSVEGSVHIFSDNGRKRTDLGAGVYANMVRVGKISESDRSDTVIAGGANSGDGQSILVALGADGSTKWKLQLPPSSRPAIQSTYIAPGKPWIAVAQQGGTIHVVDANRGAVIASMDGQGQFPEIAWMPVSGGDPLLVVSSGNGLTAFRITGSVEPPKAK